MSVYKYYTLYCSRCRIEYKEQCEDANMLRAIAKESGWKYKKVKNGSYWDFCPACVKGLNDE